MRSFCIVPPPKKRSRCKSSIESQSAFTRDIHNNNFPEIGEKEDDNALILSAEAFNSLSACEQNRVNTELLGTDNATDEDTWFVKNKLQQLHVELGELSPSLKQSYMNALYQEEIQLTDYVNSEKFLLMFLRAELFDVTKAAMRIVNFFKEKEELFGPERLPHRIVQDDLTKSDKKTLLSGCIYLNNQIDHSGRAALVTTRQCVDFDNIINLRRVVFYSILSALEDDENSQRRGVVYIDYAVDVQEKKDKVDPKEYADHIEKLMLQSLPIRAASFHHCCNDSRDKILSSIMLKKLSTFMKARYKRHFGSHRECRSELIMYGIRVDLLPILPNGCIDKNMVLKHIEKNQRKDRNLLNCYYSSTDFLYDDDDLLSLGSY